MSDADNDAQESPLRSVSTNTFPELLSRAGTSVIVSTYQAGYVLLLRAESPDVLNTHFRRFPKPMGMSSDGVRLAIGTDREIVELRNMAAVAEKLEPAGRHDACYLPRRSHFTGDIDIHEMAWTPDELWFVNTRFSCLCTLNDEHSFVPRWQPPFISGLAPEDRCHLNGLCLIDGTPRYVTALGSSNEPSGWRENKARGGVLIDVPSNEIILDGLSMPHSPRWHNGRLWLLESGDGSIGTVDLIAGRYEPVAMLDGFTRGLSFCGPFALIGLSQVRESAVFSGIPLVERIDERICGVAIVNVETGQQVGFVKFEGEVQEIFAVEAVAHRFPDLLEPSDDHVAHSYALPDEALQQVEIRDAEAESEIAVPEVESTAAETSNE